MTKLKTVPTKVKQLLLQLKEKAVGAILEAWATEPVMVTTGTISAVVAVLAALGIVVPAKTVELVVGFLLPIALGGLIRSQVKPARQVNAPVQHEVRARLGDDPIAKG